MTYEQAKEHTLLLGQTTYAASTYTVALNRGSKRKAASVYWIERIDDDPDEEKPYIWLYYVSGVYNDSLAEEDNNDEESFEDQYPEIKNLEWKVAVEQPSGDWIDNIIYRMEGAVLWHTNDN